MLTRIQSDHRAISAAARDLAGLLDSAHRADPNELADRRWKLSCLLLQHLEWEEQRLYPLLALDPASVASSLQSRFERELDSLHVAYRSHMSHWTAEAIEADWSGYCDNALNLLGMLRRRIEREEMLLWPIFERLIEHEGVDPDMDMASRDRGWASHGWQFQDIIFPR